MGTVVEFLGENVSTVDFAGNMFYLDYEVLLLSFTKKNLGDWDA